MTDALLTPREAAELLAVAQRTLADWRYRGTGPSYVAYSGRCVRYKRRDLDAWVEERSVATRINGGAS